MARAVSGRDGCIQLNALPAMIAMTRAYNAQVQGNFSATVKYAELALQLLQKMTFSGEPRLQSRWKSPIGPAETWNRLALP